MRALVECQRANRTWFCTYTVAPEHRLRADILSVGTPLQEISKWWTKYVKRVRKQSGVLLKTLVVSEEHADGFPHLHALIHEVGPEDERVTKRALQLQWPYGFTCVRLADKDDVRYVCKYLTKSALRRVRASVRYGRLEEPT